MFKRLILPLGLIAVLIGTTSTAFSDTQSQQQDIPPAGLVSNQQMSPDPLAQLRTQQQKNLQAQKMMVGNPNLAGKNAGHPASGRNPAGQKVQNQSSPGGTGSRSYDSALDGGPKSHTLPDFSGETPSVVLPEVTTSVKMSSSDLNRISCPVEIKEALVSTEKGVSIKIQGKDAFLKFKVTKRSDGKIGYMTSPAEVFVVCGEDTFTLIAYPQRIPSQLIKLSSGAEKRIKDNMSLYSGLPFEKKILRAIKEVYTEDMADSYVVKKIDKQIGQFKDVRIIHRRTVDVEGEGLSVKEFEASLRPGRSNFKLSEKHFVKQDFATNPVAISIDKPNLKAGEFSRIFIVEHRAEKPLQLNGISVAGGLPALPGSEDQSVAPAPQQGSAPSQRPMPGNRAQHGAAGGGTK